MDKPPRRAIRFTAAIEADSISALADALFALSTAAERNELTVGASGGYSAGYTYELLQDPTQTHDAYFADLRCYLEKHKSHNDRVEGRDAALSRRVPSHDGLEGNGTGHHE